MIDANRRAHHFNRVAAGLGAEEFPDEFQLPKARGSMFGGVMLIAVGLLFLLDLNFDIPLDWLADWWPLVLVLIGGAPGLAVRGARRRLTIRQAGCRQEGRPSGALRV